MKKNKRKQADVEGETKEEVPSGKIKKRSLLASLFRGLAYFLFFIFLLVAGAGVVLEYYFPAEGVRLFVEKEGTKQLQLPLSIKKIKFSLLSGVRIDGVILGPVSEPLASVQTLVLDYDISRLLQGQIVINQILIDRPQLHAISKNGVWNFQPLLNLAAPANADSPSSDGNLPIPIAGIDLQEMTVRNASAKLDMEGNLFASLNGLSLHAKGKASLDAIDLNLRVLMKAGPTANIIFKQPKEKLHFQSRASSDLMFSVKDLKSINISGSFGLQQNQIQFGDPLPSPNLEGSLSAKVQLQPELINLSAFSLTLDDKNEIQLSTIIKNFSTAPEVELHIKKVSLQLSDILRWGAQWIPPLSGQGVLKAENLNIMARLPDFKPDNVSLKGGVLATENLMLHSPDLQIHIEKMNSSLQLNEVILKNGQPEKVSLDLKMQLAKVQARAAKIQNWKQTLTLTAKGADLSEITMRFNTDIESVHYDHPLSNKIHLPFHSKGSLSGDWKKGDIKLQKISYRSGNMVQGNISGEIKDKKSFQLQKKMNLDIAQVLKILPHEILENLPGIKASGQTEVALSFSGKLDSNFSPTDINGNSQFSLQGFSVALEDPGIQVDDLNVSLQFPLVYQAEQGVKIPTLDINARLKNLDALGNWKLSDFSASSQLALDNFYNLKPDFETLPLRLDSEIKFGNLQSTEPALFIADFKTETHLKGDLRPDDFRNAQLDGKVSFKNIKILNNIRVGKIGSRFSMQMHDKSLSRIRLSQKTKITNINQDALKLHLDEISIESLTLKNLRDGNFDVDNFLFKATDLVEMKLQGSAKKWGESFTLESTIALLKLASIWEKIPTDLKQGLGLTGLVGAVEISLKAQGNLPPAKENLKPAERWQKVFTSLDPDNLPPLEVATRFQLRNGKVNHIGKNIRAQGLNIDTRLNFKNGLAKLSGNTSVKIQGMDYFEKLPLHPEFEFDYRLENLNTFVLAKHQLELKNRGVKHTLEGKIDGLLSLLKGSLDPAKLLQNLNIVLKNENHLNINEAMEGELFGDIKAAGAISSQFKIHQSAGEKLELEGRIGFNKFAAEIPSVIALKNLTGNFPFSKSLSLAPNMLAQKTASPAQKRFFQQLRDFSRYKNNIKADSLEVAGQKISNMGMDMVFKDNRLAAEKFIFDVLGGTVGGNFSFTQSEKGPTLKFTTEFAKIDSSLLLPAGKDKNIDSKIDGNMEIIFQVETPEVSLDKLFLNIAITKIGTKTLDRLLLFIDPEESKPAIVDTRAKLKLAAPHRVLISLKNGNLNVEAWLKSDLLGIIKAPELKRIPVAGLKQFATINEQLQSLQGVLQALKVIAAKGIAFENDTLVMKY